MSKWHIGINGPAKCPAKIKCKLGGEHYDSQEEANVAHQSQLASEFGNISVANTIVSKKDSKKIH